MPLGKNSRFKTDARIYETLPKNGQQQTSSFFQNSPNPFTTDDFSFQNSGIRFESNIFQSVTGNTFWMLVFSMPRRRVPFGRKRKTEMESHHRFSKQYFYLEKS
ncbi:MAG: hypothetical protein MJZ96_08075 [Paludibacteraceae bacterium]|nr:hypothetical protein [Paludibacteraceae bacterium]